MGVPFSDGFEEVPIRAETDSLIGGVVRRVEVRVMWYGTSKPFLCTDSDNKACFRREILTELIKEISYQDTLPSDEKMCKPAWSKFANPFPLRRGAYWQNIA